MDDTKRLILALALSAVLLFIYTTFMSPEPKPAVEQKAQVTAPATAQALAPAQVAAPAPGPSQVAAPAPTPAPTPAQSQTPVVASGQPAPAAPAPAAPVQTVATGKDVVVNTPIYTLVFNTRGGALKQVVLKDYFNHPEKKGGYYVLLDLLSKDPYSLGLNLLPGPGDLSGTLFSVDQSSLTLHQGNQPGSLTFSTKSGDVQVHKTYTFFPDSYEFGFKVTVENQGAGNLELTPEITMAEYQSKAGANQYAHTGIQIYTSQEGLFELDAGDLEDNPVTTGSVDFMVMSIPYFMGVVMPTTDPTAQRVVKGAFKDGLMRGALSGPAIKLGPGQSTTRSFKIYYGPRELSLLEPLGHNLDKAVDFGWFDIIAKPMLYLLNLLYSMIGNYGIAIIIITILTKIVFWPLAAKSYKSMGKMQQLQPHIKRIKEKYKDDKQRMNTEVMQLYKTYKVNPAGGCLPMVVQIPVFIAFYKVLGASIELRHAPFMLWINDLSAPDRLFPALDLPWVGGIPVLVILMGASMFLQQKMTPTAMDPTQAKMMLLMPVMFTFIFISFPSGLVLYWFVNNLLGIAQQYFTNRKKAAVKD